MIVFYRNYKRTQRTLLSIQSVRHLFPEMDIRCLLVYDNYESEYQSSLPYFEELGVTVYLHKKIYNFKDNGDGYPDEIVRQKAAEFRKYHSQWDDESHVVVFGLFYTYFTFEYLNAIQDILKEVDDKVLIIDEDHYFTTGETIRYLQNTEYDFAFGLYTDEMGDTSLQVPALNDEHRIARSIEQNEKFMRESVKTYQLNGNIQSFNPKRLNKLFPLIPWDQCIEGALAQQLLIPCIRKGLKVTSIPTRCYGLDYPGDGKHINGKWELIRELKENNIPFKLYDIPEESIEARNY